MPLSSYIIPALILSVNVLESSADAKKAFQSKIPVKTAQANFDRNSLSYLFNKSYFSTPRTSQIKRTSTYK